ncbi:hypothetical protein [Anaeromyxobacter terrae]|uniref:hypothetical protein n=1 Tax=Anaeromyxobacter terrae TaxID=2925406 RepID=UPI001F5A6D8F|nr:hypothetical protein [Anaeromyxobacter sp. SG22]
MNSNRAAIGLLLAIAIGPARGLAFDYSGRLGLRYDRTDGWIDGQHGFVPVLNLDGAASASGYLFAPDALRLRGGLEYDRLRRGAGGDESTDGTLTYEGSASLFETRESRLGASAEAYRRVIDFTTSAAAAAVTGTRVESGYGARARYADHVLPMLSLGAFQRDSNSVDAAGVERAETTRLVEVSTQHGPGPYSARVDYRGRWNEGDLAIQDYTTHEVDANASTSLGGAVEGFASVRYDLRLPGNVDAVNPRYEGDLVRSGARWTGEASRGSAHYAYTHVSLSAPALLDRERIQQSVTAYHEVTHSPRWESAWTASLALTQDRLAAVEETAAGQMAGAVLRWRARGEARSLLLEAGPTLGLLEPAAGGSELGYGAHARARLDGAWDVVRYGIDYAIDHRSNLDAVLGWGLRQSLLVEGARSFSSVSTRLALTASATRQDLKLFGASSTRDVLLRAGATWRRHEVTLDAGVLDGVSGALQGIRGDGLFLPPEFDTHSRYAMLIIGSELAERLRLTGRIRHAAVSGPEYADQRETNVGGGLSYRIGLVTFSVEETYTFAEAGSTTRRRNDLFVRASRTFGGRFP